MIKSRKRKNAVTTLIYVGQIEMDSIQIDIRLFYLLSTQYLVV